MVNESALENKNKSWALWTIIEHYADGQSKIANYEMARRLVLTEQIITNFNTGQTFIFNKQKGIYEFFGGVKIKELLTQQTQQFATKHNQSEVINHIKNMTLKEESEWEEHIPRHLIPLKNGVFNLDTGQAEPHSHHNWFIHQLPVNHNEEATCDKIQSFLQSIVESRDVPRLMDMFGLSIYHEHILEKFFILTGEGSNGKSVLLKLLEHLIGKENTSTLSLKQLCNDNFMVANTYRKLVNYGADIGSKPIHDTSLLKNYTGGDRIEVQFKNKTPFSMQPTATLIFSANKPPAFMDDSDGMFRRPEIIKFPYTFGNEKDIAEDNEVLLANPNILQEIITEEELSGLFNTAVQHLMRIRSKGALAVQKSTKELKQQYLRMSDSVHSFVNECCEPAEYHPAIKEGAIFISATGCVKNRDFQRSYERWCVEMNIHPERPEWIPRRLKSIPGWHLEVGIQDRYDSWDKREKGVRYLRLKSDTAKVRDTANTPCDTADTANPFPFESMDTNSVLKEGKGNAVSADARTQNAVSAQNADSQEPVVKHEKIEVSR